MTPLVTVIVPVYNTERYLDQCIQSIQNQTYENLEILLINDGSTDGSGRLCNVYAEQDSRIHVIHKENGGSSSAREAGLKAAIGEYLLLVDSDDWIDMDTVECCLRAVLANNSDCVLFSYVREYADKQIDTHLFDHEFFYGEEESENRIHRRIVGLVGEELRKPHSIDSLSPICMKFYRTEVAKRGKIINEKTTGTSEDTVFNLYALDHCKIGYIDKCCYHYRKTNANSLTTRYKPDIADKWDVLYDLFLDYINQSGRQEEYRIPFYNRVACGMIGLGLNEVSSNNDIFTQASRIKRILEKPLYEKALKQFDSSYCDLKWKLFFSLCKNKNTVALTLLLHVMGFLRSRI